MDGRVGTLPLGSTPDCRRGVKVTAYYDDGSSDTWDDPAPDGIDEQGLAVFVLHCRVEPESVHADVIPARSRIAFRWPVDDV